MLTSLALTLCVTASLAQTPANSEPAAARETLRNDARAWMAAQTGTDPSWINVGSLDARVAPPACEAGYRFDFPFESRGTIRAQCDQPSRQYYLRVSSERPKQRLVAARALPAGHLVGESDLVRKDGGGQPGGVQDSGQIVGRYLRRAIEAGEAPSLQDFEERLSVLRAKRDLRSGESLDATNVQVEMIPRSRAPSGALSSLDELRRAKLRRDLSVDRLITADDLIDPRTVVIARRNLLRGEPMEASAFETVELDRRNLPPDFIGSSDGLAGAEIIGPIRAGEPIRASQIRPALMVKKGQSVVLTVARAGLELSVQAEALEDARMGDQVKLRNPESGKALAGTVTGRGTARAL